MEVVVVAPLANAAMDVALDAVSGGGMGVLACGSGRKLKTAMTRAAGCSQIPALKKQRPPRSHHMSSIKVGFPNAKTSRDPCRLQNRYSSSLVTRESAADGSSFTRPHYLRHCTVPNPRSIEACQAGEASWVCDPGAFLSISKHAALQDLLDDLHFKTGSQCALVVLKDLQGRSDLKDFRVFGTSLFNEWGIGSAKHNNGVLVLLFHEARRLEIITGTGMSTALSDAWLAGMQQRDMVPHFKEGNYPKGLESGIEAISRRLQSSAPQEWRQSPPAVPSDDALALSDATDASSLLEPSFEGGYSRHRNQSPPPRFSSGSSKGFDQFWLWGGGLLGLQALCDWLDMGSPELRQLQAELQGLQEPCVFSDASGATIAWPYQAAPNKMDLLDVTSKTLASAYASHPFSLASRTKLKVEAAAQGFGRSSLSLNLRNISLDHVEVHLPEGSLFVVHSNGGRLQPLISKDVTTLTLGPGEEKQLLLDTYCGDSGASIPSGEMVLSPYIVKPEHLCTQGHVWRWSARFQPRGSVRRPASEDFQTLEESFGMTRREAEELLQHSEHTVERARQQQEEEIVSLQRRIRHEKERLAAERQRRSQSSSSYSGSSYSSGGGSFGGGRSCGGGAGCSW